MRIPHKYRQRISEIMLLTDPPKYQVRETGKPPVTFTSNAEASAYVASRIAAFEREAKEPTT